MVSYCCQQSEYQSDLISHSCWLNANGLIAQEEAISPMGDIAYKMLRPPNEEEEKAAKGALLHLSCVDYR